jgi:polysaccharide export outer membrane protein
MSAPTFLPRFCTLLVALAAGVLSGSGARAAAPANASDKPGYIYRLTVTDRVRVTIFQEDDLTEIVRIDARGNINLKLVGDLHVAGLTVNEAQRAVEAAYRDGRFLRDPQVSISVEDYALREVSIQGQVKAPGRYVLPVEATFSVLELVTKAGGFTDIAKGSAVVVTRIGPDGQKITFTVDVDGVIRGRKSSKSSDNLLLEPGDIVYVPERII